jgi:integrase
LRPGFLFGRFFPARGGPADFPYNSVLESGDWVLPSPESIPEQLSFFEMGVDMRRIREKADELRARTRSEKTVACYESDWIQFCRWCRDAGRCALPADSDTVTLYAAAALERHRGSTVVRRIAAVRARHVAAGFPVPDTRDARAVVAGSERSAPKPSMAKAALTVDELGLIVDRLRAEASPVAVRDCAMFLFGFASGMRRSELTALELADLKLEPKGLRVTIRKSKTDQLSRGRVIGIFRARRKRLCAVAAIREWLRVRGRWEGPLFCPFTPQGVVVRRAMCADYFGEVIQRRAAEVGLDPAKIGGHSLRAGMVTAALETGAAESLVMLRTGHKSIKTMERYVRPASVFSNDPLARAL